jgi:hypothetical protein
MRKAAWTANDGRAGEPDFFLPASEIGRWPLRSHPCRLARKRVLQIANNSVAG